MNKTDPNWIVLHQGFLTKQGNLKELKSSLYTNALRIMEVEFTSFNLSQLS
jgi:hypothetical protein